MENIYRVTNTTVSMINFHLVFCPRYRRKIFLIPNVEERFITLVNEKCKEMEINILEIKCNKDHVYMLLNCLPQQSISEIVKTIKDFTGKILREEFEKLFKMQNLWTRNFFVTTEEIISNNIIQEYVESQKKRY